MVVFWPVSSAAFTIAPALFDEGELDEEAADVYERELTRLFMESPKGRAPEAEGVELGSVASVIHSGQRYEDAPIANMTAEQFDIVLFEVIPRKVMVQPDEQARSSAKRAHSGPAWAGSMASSTQPPAPSSSPATGHHPLAAGADQPALLGNGQVPDSGRRASWLRHQLQGGHRAMDRRPERRSRCTAPSAARAARSARGG